MFRFLIATGPGVGHSAGAFPIACKLIERGHEVWWYTSEENRTKVEATGAHFTPFKIAYQNSEMRFDKPASTTKEPELKGLKQAKFGLKQFFVDPVPGQVADLKQILTEFPADAIMADVTLYGAGWYHELGGPVWAGFGHLPITFNSRDTAPFSLALLPDATFKGRIRNRILNFGLNRVLLRDVFSYIDKARADLGLLTQAKNLSFAALSPYLHLQGTVPQFEYPRSDLPPQVHYVGPFLTQFSGQFTPPTWWSELQADRPVVHVTQGTLSNNPEELIIPTIQALADEDILVIATTGGKPLESVTSKLEKLPTNVRLEKFVPHYHLLPHVDVMVTNGGYNGVQIALANGVPLVTAGTSQDKPEVNNRVEWSGVGINLRVQSPTPNQIREAVKKVLREPSYQNKARYMQAEIAKYDTPTLVAELLEQLASTRRPCLRD